RAATSAFKSTALGLSYLRVRSESKKEFTEQYPDPVSSRSSEELPARTRGRLFNDVLRCTGCGDCVSACPTQCIRLNTDEGPKVGKKWISTFDVDHSRCFFCGFCVEVCQPQSLTHVKGHQTASYQIEGQVASYGRGPVSEQLRESWEKQRRQRSDGGAF
ncbi:MAG: 4Fe-4S dicluster domain-containing protein, partial [Bdellovibrionales bacterium]|nr:4Fe-4S dicluster domain-containing protein [Bdellovibrionales bacterium]